MKKIMLIFTSIALFSSLSFADDKCFNVKASINNLSNKEDVASNKDLENYLKYIISLIDHIKEGPVGPPIKCVDVSKVSKKDLEGYLQYIIITLKSMRNF